MKKSIIAKIILSIMTLALIACAFTSVFAADDDIPSLNPSLNLNNTNTQTPSNDIENGIGNSSGNSTVNNTDNILGNSTGNNTNNNSSSYQESDIPYAGPETSILIVAAFVVCGIIGIYTFTKLSDYSNI